MNTKLHFSSEKSDWETPDNFYAELHKEFKFTRDVAASAENTKCKRFWTVKDDCLTKRWGGTCWMNPPYGRIIAGFVRKAAEEAVANHATTVALLPSRTDTRWFHTYIWSELAGIPLMGVEVRFLRGRLKFKGAPHSAPFPSMIVVWRTQ